MRRIRRGKNMRTPQRSKRFRENPGGNSALKHARRNRGIQGGTPIKATPRGR